MGARGLVDVLIPRGGAGLIDHVVRNSVVPVIETGVGNCHLYVDASADPEMALAILLNAKTQRPSVCNAVETLLVHADAAPRFLPRALAALAEAGRDRPRRRAHRARTGRRRRAGDRGGLGDRVPLPRPRRRRRRLPRRGARATSPRYSTGHSETIVTDSESAAQRFTAQVDAAAVLVNASSRFVDGSEFGFGAEIGISTQKLHARGPMGLPEMTSTKYVVTGSGQTR